MLVFVQKIIQMVRLVFGKETIYLNCLIHLIGAIRIDVLRFPQA